MEQNKAKVCIFSVCVTLLFCPLLYSQDASKEEEGLFVAEKALEDGFYEVALGLLERFLKNYPGSEKTAKANLLIGQCYFHQGKFIDALKNFEELLYKPEAKNIKDEIIYWIAEVHFRGNDFSKAAVYYQKIIDEFPKSSYAAASYYSLGWCLFQEAKFNDAMSYFKNLEEKFPKESLAQDASFKIIECLYNLKDLPALKEKILNHIKVYAKDSARLSYLYFYLAEADYYLNNFPEAISGYAKVLANTLDERIQALSNLGAGWSYLKLKQYPKAEEIFFKLNAGILERKNREILFLGKGILFFETNRFSEAKNIYSELLSSKPEPVALVQAYLGKADALYNLGEYKEAIKVYQEGLDNSSEANLQEIIDKLHYGLSWAFLKEGEFKKAIVEFEKIVKQSEDKISKVTALCQIGDAYQDSGDFDKAAQTYDKILIDYPDSFYGDYVQYQLGLSLLKAFNYDGAIMALQSLKNNYPESKLLDDATYALGLAYFQREDYDSSRQVFEKFQDEFKDSNLKSENMYLLGASLYNLGKFNEAIEVFKNIIRLFSQDTLLIQKAEYEIADCYYRMGKEKEAMAKFKILRAKYPDSKFTPEIIWWLGEYYYRHNDLMLAKRYFSSLIQDFSDSELVASCYYTLGSICVEESNFREAIEYFFKVIGMGKSELAATAKTAVADINVIQEKFDLAITTYKEVINSFPNLVNIIYPKIAEAYFKMNNYAQAKEFYRKSLDIVPVKQMADIQFKIGEVTQAEGKTKEAVEEYLKTSYLYSENSSLAVKALLRVASIHESAENFKEAVAVYKKINSMNVEESKYAQERIDWINKFAR